MKPRVLFHIPRQRHTDFQSYKHLKLLVVLKEVLERHGVVVELAHLHGPYQTAKARSWPLTHFDDGNLHILPNTGLNHPAILNFALAYVDPYWHFSPEGSLAFSPIGARSYEPQEFGFAVAMPFFRKLRRKWVLKRKSRYGRAEEKDHIPENCISIFLQGEFPHISGVANMSNEMMVREVLKGAGEHPVVIKQHPLVNGLKDMKMVQKLQDEGYVFHISEANVHDIVAKSAATVSFNSSVALEGMMQWTPAILFGKSDFHHAAQTVEKEGEFAAALARAKVAFPRYKKYLYWYFNQCLDLDAEDAETQLLAVLENHGWPLSRLTGSGG
ncbi:MAG: hypothetical protein ACPGVK_07190 [Halocynthiibacter sp.]